nr:hypothetical protein [Burkholderia multivorans]
MQDYFLDFYDRSAEPVPTLVAHVRRLIDFAHAVGMPVYYTAQPAKQAADDRALLTDMWGRGSPPSHHARRSAKRLRRRPAIRCSTSGATAHFGARCSRRVCASSGATSLRSAAFMRTSAA